MQNPLIIDWLVDYVSQIKGTEKRTKTQGVFLHGIHRNLIRIGGCDMRVTQVDFDCIRNEWRLLLSILVGRGELANSLTQKMIDPCF